MTGSPPAAAVPPPPGESSGAFARAVRGVSRLCGAVAAGLVVAAVLVVCQMVFVRYALGHSTIWQTDFTIYCLIGATFIGSPYVLMTRGHVNVDVIPQYLGAAARYRLAVFAHLVTIAFALVLAGLAFRVWHEAWSQNWVSDTMWRARLWIPYATMPVGMGLVALQAIVDFADLLAGREPPFGMREERR